MSLETSQRDALRDILKHNAEQPIPRRPHRVAIAAAIAGPVAIALVVVSVVVPGRATAQAAEILRQAADQTITTSDPVVETGEFLKITTDAAYLAYESAADGNLTAYLSPSITEVWVPAGTGDDWVQRVTAERATAFYGGSARAAAERDWKSTVAGGVVRTTRAANGEFVEVHELGGEVDLGDLPDSPQAALNYLHSGADPTDAGALAFAAQLLRDGTMKAAERAVLYDALALLPGIRITDDTAVLDGRTGVAFSLDPVGVLDRQEIIIDPTTGQFIGERELATADQGAVPAGTSVAYTAVTVEVVNSAP